MRRILGVVVFGSLWIFAGCSASKKVPDQQVQQSKTITTLSEDNQRRFDFFFYEANREKMLGNHEKAASYYGECLRIDPASGACMVELSNILLMNKQVNEAVELMERATSLYPDNEWYHVFLSQLYMQTNNSVKAIGIYERLLQFKPTKEDYLYGLAQLYAQNGKFDAAIKMFNRLEAVLGINEGLVLEKEKVLLAAGKEKAAYAEMQRLIKKFPMEARFHGYLGDLYSYFEKGVEAERSYRNAMAMDSNQEHLKFSIANLYLQKGDSVNFRKEFLGGVTSRNVDIDTKLQRVLPFLMKREAALPNMSDEFLTTSFLALLENHPNDSRVHIFYANYLKNKGLIQPSIDSYKRALELNEYDEGAWQDLLLLELSVEDYKMVIQDGAKAFALFPENALFSLLYGSTLLHENNAELALEVLEKGLPFVGDNKALNSQILAVLGDTHYKLGQSDKAFKAYDESLKINEQNIGVLNNYSYYLSVEEIELDKAERMSSKCVELEPSNSTYLDTYAWVLFKKKRYLEAKFIIERAIDNSGSGSGTIVEHYGDILYFNGDIDGAVKQWIKAESIGDTTEFIRQKIETKTYISSK
jgi:tetratricopeptide (TPR) repeat protein